MGGKEWELGRWVLLAAAGSLHMQENDSRVAGSGISSAFNTAQPSSLLLLKKLACYSACSAARHA
jgi:hypothetical protein